MDLLDFKIGAKLSLDIFDEGGERVGLGFASQFEEAFGPDEANVLAPVADGSPCPVRAGWKATVYMQEGYSFYRFHALVLERLSEGSRRLVRIKRTSDITSAPRRQCYRLAYAAPLRYRVVEWPPAGEPGPFSDTRTADISSGGLRFYSNRKHAPGELMECELTLGDRQIYVPGKVARCQKLQQTDGRKPGLRYDIGLLFSEIEPWQQDIIFKFIFERERQKARVRTYCATQTYGRIASVCEGARRG